MSNKPECVLVNEPMLSLQALLLPMQIPQRQRTEENGQHCRGKEEWTGKEGRKERVFRKG